MAHARYDVLLLAAFHPELAPLRATLGHGMEGRIGEYEVAARTVGVGLAAAAAGTAAHLCEVEPRAVILVGTCGAYRDVAPAESASALRIGEVVAAQRVRLAAPSVVDGLAQFPGPMSLVAEAHPPTVRALALAGARVCDVANTLAITVNDAAAARLARDVGVQAEHLEAYGVAAACAARGIPFATALGVANVVGLQAREQWKAHQAAASAAAVDVVLRFLAAGGSVVGAG